MDNTEMTVMEQIARVQIKELARYLSPSALECIKKKLNNKIKAEKKREDGIKTIIRSYKKKSLKHLANKYPQNPSKIKGFEDL